MTRYETIAIHSMKKSTRVASFFAGFCLMVVAIICRSPYSAIVGLVMIVATMYQKNSFFTAEGYEVVYNCIFFQSKSVWRYGSISNIHREPSPDPGYMGLLIQHGLMFKRAVVPVEDVNSILKLAKEINPSLYIGDVDN